MNRRVFCRVAGAALLTSPLTGFAVGVRVDPRIMRIARACLRSLPSADACRSRARFERLVRGMSEDVHESARLRQAVAREIVRDFLGGAVMTVEGVTMSEMEVGMALSLCDHDWFGGAVG